MAGCAYVVPFRKQPAYRYSVKHSIYVHPERLGIGVGRALLPVLIERCAEAGYHQLIGYLDAANTVVAEAARGLRLRGGRPLARGPFKFDRWADTIMVQRALGPGCETVPDSWDRRGPVAPPLRAEPRAIHFSTLDRICDDAMREPPSREAFLRSAAIMTPVGLGDVMKYKRLSLMKIVAALLTSVVAVAPIASSAQSVSPHATMQRQTMTNQYVVTRSGQYDYVPDVIVFGGGTTTSTGAAASAAAPATTS